MTTDTEELPKPNEPDDEISKSIRSEVDKLMQSNELVPYTDEPWMPLKKIAEGLPVPEQVNELIERLKENSNGPPSPNEAIERLDETQEFKPEEVKITIGRHELKGYAAGEDLVISPPLTHTTEQVNAIQAQVEFCQQYIVLLEKMMDVFLAGTDKAIDLDKRVELAVVGWRIIQDENAMLKAQMETLEEESASTIADWKESSEMCSGMLSKLIGDDWKEWTDIGRLFDGYVAAQRHMREDNANQAATIARLELENRALGKACDRSD